jgi:starch phosphorylase
MNELRNHATLKNRYLGLDVPALRESLADHLVYSVGKDLHTATHLDMLHSTAYAVRDRLIEHWMETMRAYYRADAKRVYYLSMEFLIGRSLTNGLLNLGIYDECREALESLGFDLEDLRQREPEAALGNGGLGRLAACFMDSIATLRIPGYGYGIRYEYGMFKQHIENGCQVEAPENWLRYGNPWEFGRPEVLFPVRFGGRVIHYRDREGCLRADWTDTREVMAMAYDTMVPGFATNTVNNMRLWAAKSSREFDLKHFNEGEYVHAVEDKYFSENLSRVLYPNDATQSGRELRLQQEYFFVSASLQDILYRYNKFHDSFDELPLKVAIHLNDTHPVIAIPELMRILLDEHCLEWDSAWTITRGVFSYTNHTLMPEALETWPVPLFESLLPRHLEIIYEINQRFLSEVRHRHPGDSALSRRVSLIDESGHRSVRMAHLALVGCSKVNGVSMLHTALMKNAHFSDFDRLYPDRIINITNGITPRRWLHHANPSLSQLIDRHLGRGWVTDLDRLDALVDLSGDADFQRDFAAAKRLNKLRLAERIRRQCGIEVLVDTLFDVQVKRFHEYKRQLLNVLHIVTRYNRLRHEPQSVLVPRTVIFAGKAAPGYRAAKLVIKLIHDVADVINNDPAINGMMRVAFIPDYGVTLAGDIIPAAELSEQLSTAGTEASGTGNMKLALNGALTIGTRDGANIEIAEAVGEENIFLFGLDVDEVAALRASDYDPDALSRNNPELRLALDMIAQGYFSPADPARFREVVDGLTLGGDRYAVIADYAAYLSRQDDVDRLYRAPAEWNRRAIVNCARMGRFSSDRALREYAEQVWHTGPVGHD